MLLCGRHDGYDIGIYLAVHNYLFYGYVGEIGEKQLKYLIEYEGGYEEAVPYKYDTIQIIRHAKKKIIDIKKLYVDGTVSDSVFEKFKKYIKQENNQ